MKAAKFGGTSVKDAEALGKVLDIASREEDKTLIVVSALSGVTNLLTDIINFLRSGKAPKKAVIDKLFDRHSDLAENLGITHEVNEFIDDKKYEFEQLIYALDTLGETSPKSMDMILSFGEMLSSNLIYHFLKKNGLKIAYLDARKIINTDAKHTEANIDLEKTTVKINNICVPLFDDFDMVITQGFIAADGENRTTTLGRGGSDYSASIIASIIGADTLDIWTDVDGILTSNPAIVDNTLLIKRLSYTEASELAFFGAKVLHPKTILPAVQKEIPVYIKNTFRSQLRGTEIKGFRSAKEIIKAVTFRKNISVINIYSNRMLGAHGFLSKVFEVFKKHETSVDVVTTSEVNISLTIDDDSHLDKIRAELDKFAEITVHPDLALIAVIGEGIKNTSGIGSRFFKAMEGINIYMISLGASEVNLSIVVSEDDVEKAVQLLHEEFFSKDMDNEIFEKIN